MILNEFTLIGVVGQRPEVRTTPSKKEIVRFSIGTKKWRKGSNGKGTEEITWHDLNCLGKTAEAAKNFWQVTPQ